MTTAEDQLLHRIAAMAGIPRKAAAELIHETMTHFAGKRSMGGAGASMPK